MKLKKILKCELEKLRFSKRAISLGVVFGLMFWLTLDSIALGISLGFVMMIAFNEEEKTSKGKKKK